MLAELSQEPEPWDRSGAFGLGPQVICFFLSSFFFLRLFLFFSLFSLRFSFLFFSFFLLRFFAATSLGLDGKKQELAWSISFLKQVWGTEVFEDRALPFPALWRSVVASGNRGGREDCSWSAGSHVACRCHHPDGGKQQCWVAVPEIRAGFSGLLKIHVAHLKHVAFSTPK